MTINESIKFYEKIQRLLDQNIQTDYIQSVISQTSNAFNAITQTQNYFNSFKSLSKTMEILQSTVSNIDYHKYLSTFMENFSKTISNKDYIDTINYGIDRIVNSNINLNDLLINKDMSYEISEDTMETFKEEDKEETIKNINEIIDIVEDKSLNTEQLIYNKLVKLKEKHPLVAIAIYQLFWIVISIIIDNCFTNASNHYYIQNYITINNTIISTESQNQDFITNARYVKADNLNVRKGPNKNYDIICTLKYGDVVKVKNNVKYWTEIEFINKENDIRYQGWVYTRYLEKFNLELLDD